MGTNSENPLDAAERHFREANRSAEASRHEWEASEAASAEAASEAASQLISQCLDRLVQAGRPPDEKISVSEYRSETTGLLRKRTRQRTTLTKYEVWIAPTGIGYRTGLLIGAMLGGGWERIYRDSQIAIGRDGTLWHGAATEKSYRSWGRLDPPSNEAKVEALTEVLGGILAKYVPAV